jgi:hypothetical protein
VDILNNIRKETGFYFLNRKEKQLNRVKVVHNFNTAQTIGILFNPDKQETFELLKDFIVFLTDKNIHVNVLGYFDGKEIPQMFLFRKGIEFFTKNDINWFYRPKRGTVDEFINTSFDILIDLTTQKIFPVKYIVRLSNAKFKVGTYGTDKFGYDLMIKIDKEQGTAYFIEQLKYYLSIINTK